jgi:aspartyl-tRNA(Asn)/glutamyl-tRNA(Gln) amidotransferase subunit B
MNWLDSQELIIPHQIIKKFKQEYWFNKEYINWLINDQEVLDYFLSIVNQWLDPKITAKWIVWPISAYMKENFVWINELKFDQQGFIEFIKIAMEWKIMDNQMKVVMDEMLLSKKSAKEIIDEKWFNTQWMDDNELENIVQSVINENPAIVEQYKWWKTTTLGFFVWQVMKKTAWKANPKVVGDIVTRLLN